MFANRWWVVAGAALAQTVGMGPLLQFTFSVFLLPLTREFGADRGQVSLALTSALLATAIAVPLAGRMIDRFDIRRLTSIAVLVLAASLVALAGFAQSLVGFTVMFTAIGIAASLHTPLAYTKIVSMRFDRDRGLALGVTLTGVGIGTIIVPQITQQMIDAIGWRGAYVGLACLLVVVALPAIQLCMRDVRRATDTAVPTGAGLSVSEAMRSGRFWRLIAGTFLAAVAVNGTVAHLVPMAIDAGFAAPVAVRLIALFGISSIVGRLTAGRLADRVWAPAVAAGFFALAAVGVLLLSGGGGTVIWLTSTILIGLGLGAEADLIALVVTRYCGTRAFGQLFGFVFSTFILASSIGPLLMGLTFARFGSYSPAMVGFVGCLIVAGVMFLTLGRYDYPPPMQQQDD